MKRHIYFIYLIFSKLSVWQNHNHSFKNLNNKYVGCCFVLILFFFKINIVRSQETILSQKKLSASKIETPPIIDGKLDDATWNNLPKAKDFILITPYNGKVSNDRTEVMITYDNNALYVGAILYDNPDSIQKSLSQRDVYQSNSDKFCVQLIPFNDGLNGYELWVTAAGVQLDFKKTGQRSDDSWNEVWESAVAFNENGWTAEFRIPFSVIRFSSDKEQTWGLNFLRVNRRKATLTSWNFIDDQTYGMLNQCGLLSNLHDILPPIRLSFTPYTSAYLGINENKQIVKSLKGGLDIKYGLNKSFTLDMMLIPDFGQVQSDDVVLNLSPYEIAYRDQRQFFNEGSELFNKGRIFYSKRIGESPVNRGEAGNNLNSDEIIINNPANTQLINATKISGRTDNGLGIGFLNAMTSNTYATIRDTITGEERSTLTQAFTNYNMTVLDKNLKNNSYISFANTNLYRNNYSATVSAIDYNLRDKKNRYLLRGVAAMSNIKTKDIDNQFGHRVFLNASKVSGNFNANAFRSIRSNTYDNNDLGFTPRNNIIYNGAELSYKYYKQFWKILRTSINSEVRYMEIYKPRAYNKLLLSTRFYTQFLNYSEIGIDMNMQPIEDDDYDEARVEGRIFKDRPYTALSFNYSTDERKKYNLRTGTSIWQTFDKEGYGYSLRAFPTFALNNKTSISYQLSYSINYNNRGYVATSVTEDTIYFGNRDVKTLENVLALNYSFNKNASLSFRVRHYWSEVLYKEYLTLNKNGYLDHSDYYGDYSRNFNVFNIDLSYNWQFSPGSEMSVVWKNSINSDSNLDFYNNYFEDFSGTISSPQINTFSIRILYYIDYLMLKHAINK